MAAVPMMQPKSTGLDDGPSVKRKAKGDHKRVARPIAPATVTVRDGEIVVVVPDVLGKNEATTGGRRNSSAGARFLSKATKNYRASIYSGVERWSIAKSTVMAPHLREAAKTQSHSGAWRLEVIGVWPNETHQVGFPAPRGDADAAIPQALDALQHAGILDDDARVVEVRAWNLYRKGERWTVIRLVRVPDLAERDAAIAHLVATLPPPATPAEPKPRTKAARRKRKETA